MSKTVLQKQIVDREFERRSGRFLAVHLLAMVPLLLFAGLVRLEYGQLPPMAVIVACASYVAVTLMQYAIVKKAVLEDLRREGLADSEYQPPDI